jgi:hypothetical protein
LREDGVLIGVGPGGLESPAFDGTDCLLAGGIQDAASLLVSQVYQGERRVGAGCPGAGSLAGGAPNEGKQLVSDLNPFG